MPSVNEFAQIASIAGDPTRANMLNSLMDGRALTAGELARHAGITPQTASGHLQQLLGASLLLMEKQGRHRYYRLAAPSVAKMIEAIMEVAVSRAPVSRPIYTGPKDREMRLARTCYDHIAGALGVGIADALVAADYVELDRDNEASLLTENGLSFLSQLGIEMTAIRSRMYKKSGRLVCRACLDWSERRPHIAGLLGKTICDHSLSEGWIRRRAGTRTLEITAKGQQAYHAQFGLQFPL